MGANWKEVCFGEIFDISSSKRVLQKQWKTSGVPFYRAREIVKLAANGHVENDLFISDELYNEFSSKYGVPQPGDLMISAVGTLGACYAVKEGDTFYFKDASVLRFSPRQDVDTRYIQHAFRTDSVLKQIHAGSGSTVGTYTISRAKKTKILLPPLEEQKRIAKILDAADALRAKRRDSLAQLDALLQSTFLDLFGDPAINSKEWPKCVLGNVIEFAKDGPHVSPKYSDDGIPFLSARHIRPGEIIWEDLKYLDEEEANVHWKKCRPKPGDVLYTKGGTTGIAAAVRTSQPFAVWVHIALLRPKKDIVNAEWLEAMLNTSYCYQQSQRYTHGIANRDLGLKRMVKIDIYLPPLKLQEEFAEGVKLLSRQKDLHLAHLRELDQLFLSLQGRAFSGEL